MLGATVSRDHSEMWISVVIRSEVTESAHSEFNVSFLYLLSVTPVTIDKISSVKDLIFYHKINMKGPLCMMLDHGAVFKCGS